MRCHSPVDILRVNFFFSNLEITGHLALQLCGLLLHLSLFLADGCSFHQALSAMEQSADKRDSGVSDAEASTTNQELMHGVNLLASSTG